ncbi:MAG: DNA polymerase [Ilumatobacteraceae bacterium]
MLICIDFETYYDDTYSLRKMSLVEYVRSPQFKVHGAAVKVAGTKAQWISGSDLPVLFESIDWATATVVGHNLAFDGLILSEHYRVVPMLYLDTLGISRAVHGTSLRKHSLDSVSRHLGRGGKLDGGKALGEVKGVRDLSPEQEARLGNYACIDAEETMAILFDMLPRFPDTEVPLLDLSVRCVTQPVMRINSTLLYEANATEVAEKQKVLDRISAERVSVNSNKLFAELLQAEGVVPPTKMSVRTNKETYAFAKSDEEFMALLEHESPRVRALVEARLRVKSSIMETRTLRLADAGTTGLFPIELNYCGAMTTQRFSGGGGFNVQNFTRGSALRRAIEAPEGYVVMTSDLSQIELRIAAALANEHWVIDSLRSGRCVYSALATQLFNVEVSKELAKKDEEVNRYRQIGKVTELQGIYGSGGGALRRALWQQTKGKITLSEAEAWSMIRTFRKSHANIVSFWERCDRQLHYWMRTSPAGIATRSTTEAGVDSVIKDLAGSGDVLNVPFLRVDHERIIGPHGLALKYPGVQAVRDADGVWGMAYDGYSREGNGTIGIYGSKMFENTCISGETDVLTDRGWVRLDTVSPTDRVWDGVEFVSHDGLAYKGVKEVIDFGGVRLTPDHRVLAQRGWVEAQHCKHSEATGYYHASQDQGHHRATARQAHGSRLRRIRWQKKHVDRALRVRGHACRNESVFPAVPVVRLQQRAAHLTANEAAWAFSASCVCGLERHHTEVPEQEAQGFQELRRTRNNSLHSLVYVRWVLGRDGGKLRRRVRSRKNRQRRRLQQDQLPVGVVTAELQQQEKQGAVSFARRRADSDGNPGSLWSAEVDHGLQEQDARADWACFSQTAPVFDILNAGPRRRFTVRGADLRPFLVHNCQWLARIVMTDAMLKIMPYLRIVMTVHDELVLLVPSDAVEQARAFVRSVMSASPTWWPELPVDCEIGVGRNYGEAK